jgi:hypothetical protein
MRIVLASLCMLAYSASGATTAGARQDAFQPTALPKSKSWQSCGNRAVLSALIGGARGNLHAPDHVESLQSES